jgi:preprotein translocase subunit SecF
MSPVNRRDDNLKDLEMGSGGRPPDEDAPVGAVTEEEDLTKEGTAPESEEEVEDEIQEELVEEEEDREAVKADAVAGHGPRATTRLYRGETSFDFVGRRRWWFLLSAVVIVAGLASLGFRGLNLGIEFKGGTAWTVKTSSLSQTKAETIVTKAGLNEPIVEVLGRAPNQTIEVQADLNSLTTKQRTAESAAVIKALAKAAGVNASQVSTTHVGPTWGSQVTQRALEALIVFFIVVGIYISFRFEPKMALAAFIAMVHDLAVTVGVYSLTGFQVSPDTVIAVLTILGYSLYDTVVVFDRVRDNSKGFGASGRMTYSEMINLSMNQTLARSINTSLVAILPVLAVLVIGAELLGAVTLQQYGLALTVGLLSGAYSSIFIASPVLAILKEREPRYTAIRQRLESRGDRVGLLTPAAAALAMAGPVPSRQGKGPAAGRSGALRPGAAKGRARPTAAGANAARTATGTAGNAAVGGARSAGAGAGARPPSAGGQRRPPPRPRKGGGKGKGKRRRRPGDNAAGRRSVSGSVEGW